MYGLVGYRLHRRLAFFSVALISAALVGCDDQAKGPPLAKSTGTVTYKSKPISGATVTFMYDDGQVASGITDDAGKFNMTTGGREGAPIGKAKVTISKIEGAEMIKRPEDLKPEDMIKMNPAMGGGKPPTSESKHLLPERYSSTSTSGLEADVRDDTENTFTYPLVD